MARIRSRDKRKARQQKQRSRTCESNVSNVGGLFIIGAAFERGRKKAGLTAEQIVDIKLSTRLALQTMISGDSTDNDWGMITGAINLALVLAEQGYGIEHESVFIRAQEALVRSHVRGTRTGKWRFDGEGLQDIRDAIDLHEQQCDIVSGEDIEIGLNEVNRRLNSGIVFEVQGVAA